MTSPENLINYAIHIDHVADLLNDTALSVQLKMTANGIRAEADIIAQMPVFVPPPRLVHSVTVIPFPRFCDVTPTPPEAVA